MSKEQSATDGSFDERWLKPYGVVPVDVPTTSALIREIQRLRSALSETPRRSESGETFLGENDYREALLCARVTMLDLVRGHPVLDLDEQIVRIDKLLDGESTPSATPCSDQVLTVTASPGKGVVCMIRPNGYEAGHFGLILADCIRHVASAFNVDEDVVYSWVRKEMDNPSTKIEGGRVQ